MLMTFHTLHMGDRDKLTNFSKKRNDNFHQNNLIPLVGEALLSVCAIVSAGRNSYIENSDTVIKVMNYNGN